MTDEAKALVKWLRSMRSPHTGPAADLIETQAREIKRLREALVKVMDCAELAAIQIARATIAGRAALAGDSHDQ